MQIRVWDWTVRASHWLFAILFGLMWWTAEEGHIGWHTRIGLVMLGVLVFRLYWGFAGPVTAKLVPLLPRPRRLWTYLRTGLRRPYRPSFGHNPLGGLSVLGLLAGLAAMVGTGLFSADVNGFAEGPLAFLLSFGEARDMADRHEQVFDIVILLVGLHLVAITLYAVVLRANLIGPMVTGMSRRGEPLGEAAAPVGALWGRVVIGVALSAGLVFGLLQAGP